MDGHKYMSKVNKASTSSMPRFQDVPLSPGIDSRYRLIVVAALRSKQLVRGALPRIVADPLKRRNTSIALEEVRQGLVEFTIGADGATPGETGTGDAEGS
jgi:DNA-directed RNA polymerase omega subunit